jgi:DNA-binding NarL/FixJ family response regulator
MTSSISIAIADDRPVIRRGLREILSGEPQIEVVVEAASGPELLHELEHHNADIAIVDLTIPNGGTLNFLSAARQRFPHLRILILNMNRDPLPAIQAVRNGADGCLDKDIAPEELVRAVVAVSQGQRYFSQAVAGALAEAVAGPERWKPEESLSTREFEVLCRLGQGQTISEIAAGLNLSIKTVSTYRTRLLEKLRLRTTGDLVRYAVERRLIP